MSDPSQELTPAQALVLKLLRVGLFALGAWMFVRLTGELVLHGRITYSIGEVVDETVVTRTLGEALAVWVSFGALMVGMMILGAAPTWFIRYRWLWKALLGTAFGGYVLGSLCR